MRIEKLTRKDQLENLKRNDMLVVEWVEGSTAERKGEPITMARIWGINSLNEVIVRKKDNLYFSIDNFIIGCSAAKEVYKVAIC